MKARSSSFELLRILSMMAIVMGHLLMYAGAWQMLPQGNRLWFYLLGSGSRVAVNVFLMIGVWFMVGARFSARRIISLYAVVITYSIPLTILMLAIGYPVPVKEICRGLFPFWGRGLWFASAYIILLFWAPFLSRAFRLPRKAQRLLLVTLFLFTSVVCTLPDPQMSYALDLYWFACIYLFVGYIKHETNMVNRVRPWLCISMGLLVYCLMATANWYGATTSHPSAKWIAEISYQWLVDFKTVPNAVSAFFIFIGFAALGREQWHSKTVNALACGTFGVYVLHCTPSFHGYLFREIVRVRTWIASDWSVCLVLVSALGIFAICSLIDWLRRRVIVPIYAKSVWFGRLCAWVDHVYCDAGLL